ncbi:Protein DSF2 [Drechmeria coniospora]|uniref:Protein DSF2 n=1 Tax=Drechmeria coniospora TaxID=98403 RepID=A0A151GA56_DRECN|nr:Protein DSF2 [Drechmeria coniospora]KYK53967.1 Protein DSF2 [Drechmeria coniospora]
MGFRDKLKKKGKQVEGAAQGSDAWGPARDDHRDDHYDDHYDGHHEDHHDGHHGGHDDDRRDDHHDDFASPRSDARSRRDVPAYTDDDCPPSTPPRGRARTPDLGFDFFRTLTDDELPREPEVLTPSLARRLAEQLHLAHRPPVSQRVPSYLPEIVTPDRTHESQRALHESQRAIHSQWERRAILLADKNRRASKQMAARIARPDEKLRRASRNRRSSSSAGRLLQVDAVIQDAIAYHEEGQYQEATAIFARLADPDGANNPLSQVLYGLALRHGWGCEADPEAALYYLSAGASNAAAVEETALRAGIESGGAGKGELVLAIFELANSFRHGWGLPRDAFAAKQYYETAANLGDVDAMNEVAWCYLEGFGCDKNRFVAAKYYRMAESAGSQTMGNSWIWKKKYNPAGDDGDNAKKQE